MATPTAAELDAILDAVLVGGARKAAELKAAKPLCFGYKTADGRVGPVVFMPNKSDGACVIENKCDASLLSGKPSRETPRDFVSRADSGRSAAAHACRAAQFCASCVLTFWLYVPAMVVLQLLDKTRTEALFFGMLNAHGGRRLCPVKKKRRPPFRWFAATNPRVFHLGFQGGLPVPRRRGAARTVVTGPAPRSLGLQRGGRGRRGVRGLRRARRPGRGLPHRRPRPRRSWPSGVRPLRRRRPHARP